MSDPRSPAFVRRLLAFSRPGLRGGRFLALEDIEHAEAHLGWTGTPGALLAHLEASGILNRDVEGFRITEAPAVVEEEDAEFVEESE